MRGPEEASSQCGTRERKGQGGLQTLGGSCPLPGTSMLALPGASLPGANAGTKERKLLPASGLRCHIHQQVNKTPKVFANIY